MEDKKSMPWITKLSYGVGHIFNDLCASMWFTYLLIFYEKVLEFDPTVAGLVLLVGQVADGISTPIVGIFSDKENKFPACAKYGRRKVWHLLGTVLVSVSFPFIFNNCLGCDDSEKWVQFAYYVIFICIFQFGWACVQISHLALIPDLTTKKHQRTELNSIRYAFTVLSNLSVFAITFVVLNTQKEGDAPPPVPMSMNCTMIEGDEHIPTGECPIDTVGPEDATKFRNISLIVVAIGGFFSALFHLGVKEPAFIKPRKQEDVVAIEDQKPPKEEKQQEVEKESFRKMRKIDWFKEKPFYQIAVLYMATRLYVNLYQVYIPLYVQETLFLSETFIAIVPFVMYLAGFVGSLVMKQINKKIGRKGTFALGCVVGLGGCLWIWFGKGAYFTQWGIFLVAALLGIGGSTLLITSLSITADLIGNNVEGGAFVYGFMSLVDKISNGVIIMVIQDSNPEQPWYYRSVITFACGASCLVGIAITITLINVKVGRRRGDTPVLEVLEDDSDQSDGGLQGIDNPAMVTVSNGKLGDEVYRPAKVCHVKGEDNPAMCQLGLRE